MNNQSISEQTNNIMKSLATCSGKDITCFSVTELIEIRKQAIAELGMGISNTEVTSEKVFPVPSHNHEKDVITKVEPIQGKNHIMKPVPFPMTNEIVEERDNSDFEKDTLSDMDILKQIKDNWN